MKKLIFIAIIAALAVPAMAAQTHYRFTFTGADLINNVYVDGADGSTPVDNDLYDGARLLRDYTSGTSENAGRTFRENQQEIFGTRFQDHADAGNTLSYFNLWGLDGKGAGWGEDYKPTEWLSATGPESWETYNNTWEWGDPPSGYITDEYPAWYAPLQADGVALDGNDNQKVFSVDLLIDPADAWWGQGTGDAPNNFSTPELTIWFGGWIQAQDGEWLDIYEGNMTLTGTQIQAVPVPGALLLGGLGVGCVSYLRRRRSL